MPMRPRSLLASISVGRILSRSVVSRNTDIAKIRNESLLGGGRKRIDAQHSRGQRTARERIDILLDDDSFTEYGVFMEHNCTNLGMENNKIPCDSVVTGHGTVYGRRVFLYRLA